MGTSSCCGIDQQFDRDRAADDLRNFRRRGPELTTRRLLATIRRRPLDPGATLLDIGGGIGALHHELLDHGYASAVHVDRSQAFLDSAAEESTRTGHIERVRFVQGDFRDVAASLEVADLVTLDRVICCDPDFATLLPLAAGRTRKLLALTVPHDRGHVRFLTALSNLWRGLTGNDFRVYVHPRVEMDALLERLGLRRTLTDALVVGGTLGARALTPRSFATATN